MQMIRPNSRVQFTAEDIDFVLQTLGTVPNDTQALTALLADESSRDQILDNEKLFHALLESPACLRVSTHFYFYVLVRQVLKRAGLADRSVADYVAGILAEFSHAERMRFKLAGQNQPLDYFFEMLAALQNADEYTTFLLRAHIGNHSLFLSGVFAERIRHRAEFRGFPDLRYYEDLGRTNFRLASDHRLARKYELSGVFGTLAEQFQTTRLALNELTDRLFNLGDPDFGLPTILGSPAKN